MNTAGNSAYPGGTKLQSKLTTQASKEDPCPQAVIAQFTWLVIFIAAQYITEDHIAKKQLG